MPVRSVTLQPPAHQWADLARAHFAEGGPGAETAGDLANQARRFRQQLGLPTDRPVVLSGHQAALWHPGILAKRIALAALARRSGAAPGWVLVDQDPEDFSGIAVPVRPGGTGAGRWARRRLATAPQAVGARLRADTVPGAIDAFAPPGAEAALNDALGAGSTDPAIAQRCRQTLATLARHQRPGTSAALQIDAAQAELLGLPPVTIIRATAMCRTDLFAAMVARMTEAPEAMARAYNRAVAAQPGARVAPLKIAPAPAPAGAPVVELPLWIIDPDSGVRRRATTANLGQAAPPMLAPRGLFMTLLLRLAACDLFIHGTGGGAGGGAADHEPSAADAPGDGDAHGYDRVTERWAAAWLGRSLAPAVVATATVTLRLDGAADTTEAEAAAALWRFHSARHNPGLLGELGAQRMKHALLALPALLPAGPRRRVMNRRIFARLHALVAETSRARAERLAGLGAQARAAREAARERAVTHDRAWAAVLHAPDDLSELASRIEAELAPGPGPRDGGGA